MKWIGQHIYDYVANFRNTVIIDNVSISAVQTSGEAFVDNDTSIMTSAAIQDKVQALITAEDLDVAADSGTAAVDLDSQSLTVTGGTSITTSATGQAVTINADATQAQITSLGAAGATTDIAAGDLTMYNAVNDGNPTISLGSSATNRLEIKSVYNSGAQTLCDIDFTTYTASSTNHDGRFNFYVDEVQLAVINDGGITSYGYVNATDANGSFQATDTTASSATQGGELRLQSNDGAAMGVNHRLGVIRFRGAEDASSNFTTGARIEGMADAAWSASENGGRLDFYTTDGNASESKVLTLDSNKLAAFTGGLTIAGDLSVSGDTTTFHSTNANDPVVIISNGTDDADGGRLQFLKNRDADGQDNDKVGVMEFWSFDDGTPTLQQYAKIYADIHDATSDEESGRLTFQVANHDGGLGSGLILTGGSADNEIDTTIGLGTSSVTTVAGTLTMGSTATINNSGVIQVATQGTIDHDSLANFVANEHIDWTASSAGTIHSSNYTDTNTNQLTEFTLTGDSGSNQTIAHGNTLDIAGGNAISTVVGATDTVTINHDDTSSQASVNNSGNAFIQDVTLDTYGHVTGLTTASVGTTIASAEEPGLASFPEADFAVSEEGAVSITRKAYFIFRGYGTSDGTNYEAPEILSDQNSPFEHDTSYGSDGLTAQEPRQFLKSGAYVMPYAGVLKRWTGWAASAGSGTIDMSLFKATLTRNSTTTVTPVLLKNTQFTALGNTKLEDFAETSFSVAFSAGDVIYTAVKGSTNNKLWYLDSTLEVQWT